MNCTNINWASYKFEQRVSESINLNIKSQESILAFIQVQETCFGQWKKYICVYINTIYFTMRILASFKFQCRVPDPVTWKRLLLLHSATIWYGHNNKYPESVWPKLTQWRWQIRCPFTKPWSSTPLATWRQVHRQCSMPAQAWWQQSTLCTGGTTRVWLQLDNSV